MTERETIRNAIKSYCSSVSPAAVQNANGEERIYYAGLSVDGLVDAVVGSFQPAPSGNDQAPRSAAANAELAGEIENLNDVIQAVRGDRCLLRVSGLRGNPLDVGVTNLDTFDDLAKRISAALRGDSRRTARTESAEPVQLATLLSDIADELEQNRRLISNPILTAKTIRLALAAAPAREIVPYLSDRATEFARSIGRATSLDTEKLRETVIQVIHACEGNPKRIDEATHTILAALSVPAPIEAGWQCMGRKQSLPEPGECDWPVCGCDPQADKVIAALQESGLFNSPASADAWSSSKHDEIIKRLMKDIGQPNSASIYGAFKQFANELHALSHARNDREGRS